jgi:hypothetical protein
MKRTSNPNIQINNQLLPAVLIGDNIPARRAMITFAMQERSHFAHERGKRHSRPCQLPVRDAPADPMQVVVE